MARRIKEEPIVHKNRIGDQAELLFVKKGMECTTMDDIARASGYSKATLYVYFKNKEDIVSFLALRSMEKLKDVISKVLMQNRDSRETFLGICFAMADFHENFTAFFDCTIGYICIEDKENPDGYVGQVYKVGEEINSMIAEFMMQGVKNNEIRSCESYVVQIFQIWGMLSGLIKMASEKEAYIKQVSGLSKQEFLRDGFEKLFDMIAPVK